MTPSETLDGKEWNKNFVFTGKETVNLSHKWFAKTITILQHTESTSTPWPVLTIQCFKLNGQLSNKVMGSLHNLNSGDISAPLVFLLSQCSVGQVCTIYFRLRLSAQWPECNFFLNSKACFTGNVFVCFLIVRRQCCYFHPFISL